jgi:hypothetical protein
MVRWLDHWCRGIDTGIMAEPPVQLFVQHWQPIDVDRLDSAGEWRSETAWPAPGASERVLQLAADGRLGTDARGEEGSDALAYVPTVGLVGGLWNCGLPFGLPGDQRPDEALSLTYTSEPLAEVVTVVGQARAILHLTTSARVLGFAANLSDVAPDGSSHLVAKGMLNATRRHSFSDPEPIPAGEPFDLTIPIDATAWRFEAGHRIRLTISNADFPNVWPTPETATSSVLRGASRPSRLVLPQVPDEGSAEPPVFSPSLTTPGRQATAIRPPRWEVTRDVLTGHATVSIETEAEFRVDDRTVVRREWGSISEVDPRDPAHASARGWFQGTIGRPNETIVGRADTLIRSTATDFHITIDVAVRVNGRQHAARRWVRSYPRRLL